MNVNSRIMFKVTKLCLPALKKTKGCIINISNTAGLTPIPQAFSFSVSKVTN